MSKTYRHIKEAKAKRGDFDEQITSLSIPLTNPPDSKRIKTMLKRRWRTRQKAKIKKGDYDNLTLDKNYEDTEYYFY